MSKRNNRLGNWMLDCGHWGNPRRYGGKCATRKCWNYKGKASGTSMRQPDATHYEGRGAGDRLTELMEIALRRGEHLWVATAAWLVTDPESEQLLLDRENLAMEPAVLCYVCEEGYSKRLAHRRCPGEPKG